MRRTLHRIYAVFLRQYLQLIRAPERVFDLFFWAIILDFVTLGSMARWTGKDSPNFTVDFQAFILCLVAWRAAWGGCYEFAIGFFDECWNRSLTNLVVSPLSPVEWFLGNSLVTFTKALIVFALCSTAAWFLFEVSVPWLNPVFLLSVIGLFLFGTVLGCAAIAVVLRLGLRAQFVGWSLPWVAAPLSGVFFPRDLMPQWLQYLSLPLPSVHLVSFIRGSVANPQEVSNYRELILGLSGSVLWLACGMIVLNLAYQATRNGGFDHIE